MSEKVSKVKKILVSANLAVCGLLFGASVIAPIALAIKKANAAYLFLLALSAVAGAALAAWLDKCEWYLHTEDEIFGGYYDPYSDSPAHQCEHCILRKDCEVAIDWEIQRRMREVHSVEACAVVAVEEERRDGREENNGEG